MSKRDHGLVQQIAQEIVETERFRLTHNPKAKTDINWYCFFGKSGVEESNGTPYFHDSTETVFDVAFEKSKHMKPETLGRILSTGVNSRAKSGRTAMPDILLASDLTWSDKDNGLSVLRKFASVVIAAAAWDILIKNMETTELADKEVDALFESKPD